MVISESKKQDTNSGIAIRDLVYSPLQNEGGWSLKIESSFWAMGHTHVFIGLSGSGKSTLIKLIMGLLKPQSGSIEISPQLSRIGYVIQEGGLFPHLTIHENLLLPFRSVSQEFKGSFWPTFKSKHVTKTMNDKLDELLSLVALSHDLLARYPHQLSGGQRQRVSLARALMLDPNLILLDEPLGALDPITRWDLQRDLKEVFNKLAKTVILITHDMNEALYFGHTITVLDQGRLIRQDTDANIVAKPDSELVRRLLETRNGRTT